MHPGFTVRYRGDFILMIVHLISCFETLWQFLHVSQLKFPPCWVCSVTNHVGHVGAGGHRGFLLRWEDTEQQSLMWVILHSCAVTAGGPGAGQ